MTDDLKQSLINYFEANLSSFNYEILAELAVLHAAKQDPIYQKLFFNITRDKFLKELKYLKDETTYKILWALLKAGQLTVKNDDYAWQNIKQILIQKAKDIHPKYLTDILVLSTKEKGGDKSDFFEKLEADLILKMREMALDDLINLLLSSLEIKKGTHYFYEKLEEELSKRIRGVKDD